MKAQCEAQCVLRTLKISPTCQAQRYNLRSRKGTTLGIDDDYASEIHDYHRSRESSTAVDPAYILNPTILIDETMRQILVNYIVEWHERFGLAPETLFITVSIVDRYLASEDTAVTKNNLQLVGIAALFIASKFEEEVPLQLSDAVYILFEQIHWFVFGGGDTKTTTGKEEESMEGDDNGTIQSNKSLLQAIV